MKIRPAMLRTLLGLVFVAATSAWAEREEVAREFEVLGVVKELPDPKSKTVLIEHEEIPGYMDAMAMRLRAREAEAIKDLQPGDAIRFRLNVTAKADFIDRVQVLSRRAVEPVAAVELEPIAAGQVLPNARLIDERGRNLELGEYRGHALALTFIYARCPLPTFCPLLNTKFLATQRTLSADATGPQNWRLLSVTIDPERDTPETLAALTAGLGADPVRWRFATGSLRDITKFALQCGLNFWDERGLIRHNLRTIVVDPRGNVVRVFSENEWTPEELATELRKAAQVR